MNKRKIGISLAVLATLAAGTAIAQHQTRKLPMDADGNGAVTRAEGQTHAAQLFARIDANRDGKLDSADRASHHAANFDAMDADKNGQLSREEFAARRAGDGMKDGRRGMRMHGGHGRWGGGGMGMGGGMLARADANNDAAVTRAEFDAAIEQRFVRIDTNRDGQITAAEREAARTAMRASRTVPPTSATPKPQ